jgi:hypothetical protein
MPHEVQGCSAFSKFRHLVTATAHALQDMADLRSKHRFSGLDRDFATKGANPAPDPSTTVDAQSSRPHHCHFLAATFKIADSQMWSNARRITHAQQMTKAQGPRLRG